MALLRLNVRQVVLPPLADVLVQAAAAGDVQKLGPPADAEHGNLPFHSVSRGVKPTFVEGAIDLPQLLVRGLPIVGGVHVVPAGEQQPVARLKKGVHQAQVADEGQDDGDAAVAGCKSLDPQ